MLIDVNKLKERINSLKISVSFNGFFGFIEEIISANKLVENIDDVGNCPSN